MGIFYIIIALIAGISLATQAAINTQLSKVTLGQPLIAALISFTSGSIILFIVCLFKTNLSEALPHLSNQPLWKFIGGSLGAFAVFTTIYLAPKVGVTNMLFFIIIGQLITAMIIDHYGLINMSIHLINWWKIIGMSIICLGLMIFFFGERWFN